jgi:hypothetical protein
MDVGVSTRLVTCAITDGGNLGDSEHMCGGA